MSDVNETLQQLVDRRLREMGKKRGRDDPLPLLEAFQAVENPEVTYELLRRVQREGHRNIRRPAVRTIATMLGVTEDEVSRAAGQLPPRDPFVLPDYADKLDDTGRRAVLGVIDAIIAAAEHGIDEPGRQKRKPTRPARVRTASRARRSPDE